MIDSEKIKKALDAMDNADLQKEYNPIASQKHMEMMLKTARPYLYRGKIKIADKAKRASRFEMLFLFCHRRVRVLHLYQGGSCRKAGRTAC